MSNSYHRESPPDLRGGLPLLLALAVGLSVPLVLAYKTGPPAGHTGGFSEPTCHACHSDDLLNPEGGSLSVLGFPDRYAPGETYELKVRLTSNDMGRGGFQLAVRSADAPHAGSNAGTLASADARTSIAVAEATHVQYAQHVFAGVMPIWTDSTEWTLRWTAPSAGSGSVILHVAANAANNDESEYGDRIYNVAVEAREAAKD